MNDSQDRDSGRLAPEQDDPSLAVSGPLLHRLGGPDLVCCCSLALLARELSGGRRCRVELAGDRPGDDAGWHRIPVRTPGPRDGPEAWLAVERHGEERSPPGLDWLSPLALLAGLALANHRLAREARRARKDATDVRGVLGHALRGHLHAALLRTDRLLVDFPEEGETDVAPVREQLEELRDRIGRMTEEVREVVDAPEDPGEPLPRSAAGPREDLRIPELLREAAGREGAGEAAPRVDVKGQVPPVRADPRQLAPALEELFGLARRSRGVPTLSVGPEGSPAGARIELSVDLDPFAGTGGDPGAPDERAEDRPSLRDVVDRLGGRLRVEADDRTRATVVVFLPAGGDG